MTQSRVRPLAAEAEYELARSDEAELTPGELLHEKLVVPQAPDVVAELRIAAEQRERRVGHLLALRAEATEMAGPLAAEERGRENHRGRDQQERADHPPFARPHHASLGNGKPPRRQTSDHRTGGKTVCYSFANETGDTILAARIPSTDAGKQV